MTLYFDDRWIGPHGIGRFARVLSDALQPVALGLPGRPTEPLDAWRLTRALSRLGPEGLFFNPGYTAPLWAPMPWVLTVHDLNHIDLPDNSSPAKRLYYQAVLRPGCRRASAVLTVSEYSKGRIAAWAGIDPTRIHNVGNGVDPAFNPGVAPRPHPRPYVLAVSNRRTHKNEYRLFQAFAASNTAQGHDLLITGSPTPVLDALSRQLGIEGRVQFLGAVDDTELPGLYRGARVLFFPSLYEGFGLPLIEAMACGLPCVTSTTTAMPEIAGDAAVCVDPLDVQAMARALDRALGDADLRRRLSAAGLRRASEYTWERVIGRTRQALDGVTSAH